jgi:hypothetical protein
METKGIYHMQPKSNHKLNADTYRANEWLWPITQATKWIAHLFILVGYQKVLLFKRADSSRGLGPVSETFEPKDMKLVKTWTTGFFAYLIYTAQRGASEELGLKLGIGSIRDTGFKFRAVSPNANHDLIGKTFYAQLHPAEVGKIKLNRKELSGFTIAGFDQAAELMHHPGAVSGLQTIYSETLF